MMANVTADHPVNLLLARAELLVAEAIPIREERDYMLERYERKRGELAELTGIVARLIQAVAEVGGDPSVILDRVGPRLTDELRRMAEDSHVISDQLGIGGGVS